MAYITSSDYQTAISKSFRNTFITGELLTNTGQAIPIENDDISQGSLYITNQCVNSEAFEYGAVFTAEMGITLKTELDRYSLFGSEITLNFNINTASGIETVPLGVFYVAEPSRVGRNITIKAYDGMTKLNLELLENTIGTPFELLSFISIKCGVTLAQTEEELLLLANANKTFSVSTDRIKTYRDLLAYIGMVTCTYATFNREGKLELVQFGTETGKVISADIRTASKFSDFDSYHTSVKAEFIENETLKEYAAISSDKTGLLYDMGEIPIVQGLDEFNQSVIDEILVKLVDIKYTPSDFTFNGDPSIDLGDMITCVDRRGEQIKVLVTFYKWTYRGRHQIKSVGSNPKLTEVKEKGNKELADLHAEITAKDFTVYPFENVKPIKLKNNLQQEILQIAFGTAKNTVVLFMCTIHCEFDCDGFLELLTFMDNAYQQQHDLIHYCNKGDNVITFTNYFVCETNTRYRLSIKARAYYGETDTRVQEAAIKTEENARTALIEAFTTMSEALKTGTSLPLSDLPSEIVFEKVLPSTTMPTVSIDVSHIKAAVFAQGMSGKAKWDGTLAFEEHISAPLEACIHAASFISEVETIKPHIDWARIAVEFKGAPLGGIDSAIMNDSFEIKVQIKNYEFEPVKESEYEYDRELVEVDDSFKLRVEHLYKANVEVVDSGTLQKLDIDLEKFDSISDTKVEVTNNELL